MLKLVLVALASTFTLAIAAPAGAVPPLHNTFGVHIVDVDTATCDFSVGRDFVFTNAATEFFDREGVRTKLSLQQTTMGTLTANGITLRLHIRETIIVEFAGGIPVSAKHVGLLDYIGGRGSAVFHRSGQAAFVVVLDPVSGFYVDGPLTARHGLRDDFDAAEFCSAFV